MIWKYPLYLTPKPYYRLINISKLLDERDSSYLLRRSAPSEKKPYDKNGFLEIKYFVESRSDLPGLSMNILGRFKKEHVIYRAHRYASKEWIKSKLVNYYAVLSNMSTLDNVFPILIPFNKLHNKSFPYSRNDKEYKKKIPESLRSSHIPTIELNIVHKPNNSNFWHVELDIKDSITTKVNLKTVYGESIYKHIVSSILSTTREVKETNQVKIDRLHFYPKWLYSIYSFFFTPS